MADRALCGAIAIAARAASARRIAFRSSVCCMKNLLIAERNRAATHVTGVQRH
jgi:hypothetical protein